MSESSLGRGLDALIKKTSSKNKKEKESKEKTANKKEKKSKKTNSIKADVEKIDEIKKEVEKNPRISLWSAKSAACLRYLKKTTPEFSISNEASLLLEEAVKEKYPEIWALFEDE